MPSTLIIGGTRNLGPDLVSAMLARGDAVTVLNRGITTDPLPHNVTRLKADRSDPRALGQALKGRSFELVVDTTLYNGPDASATIELLLDQVGRYVFWSTGQVYLVRTGLRPEARGGPSGFSESDYDGPIMPEPEPGSYDHGQWAYGVLKRAAEDALRQAYEDDGFPYVSLRMPMINSRRDHYGRLAEYARRIRAGEAIPVPEKQGLLKHVYGDDVITATLLAAQPEVPAGTCLNIAQDEALTIEEQLNIVGRTLGVPVTMGRPQGPPLPWSGSWMSVLDNSLSKQVLGMTYTPPSVYLPALLTGPR